MLTHTHKHTNTRARAHTHTHTHKLLQPHHTRTHTHRVFGLERIERDYDRKTEPVFKCVIWWIGRG